MFVPPVLFVLPLFFPKIIPIGTTIISSSSSSNPTVLSTLTVLAGLMDSLGRTAGTGGAGGAGTDFQCITTWVARSSG